MSLDYGLGTMTATTIIYVIIALTFFSASPPYFKNLPGTLTVKQSDVLVSGVQITTLIVSDPNLDDAGRLTVRMTEDWIDIFSFDSNTCKYWL